MPFMPPQTGDEFPTVNTLALQHAMLRHYPYNLLAEVFENDFHAVMHAYPDNIPEALHGLTESAKDVIVSRYYYGLTCQETADRRGVTLTRVTQLTEKAIRHLRQPRQLAMLTAAPRSAVERRDDRIDGLKARCAALESALAAKTETDGTVIPDIPDIQVPPTRRTLDKPVTDLDLSVRACNCLRRGHVDTVGQLTAYAPSRVMSIRNLGRHTFDEIRGALLSRGLDFAPEPDEPGTAKAGRRP